MTPAETKAPTLEQLIELLPLTGKWWLNRSFSTLGAYRASWDENYGAKTIEYKAYGRTPVEAMSNLVKEIRGHV